MSIILLAMFFFICETAPGTDSVSTSLWQPESGTREEWMKYHGMSSEVYAKYKVKFGKLLKLLSTHSTSSVQSDQVSTSADDGIVLGDIVLSEEQLDFILDDLESNENGTTDSKTKRQKRNVDDFKKFPNHKWSFPIKYKFDGTHGTNETQIIRDSFQHWMDNTCVIFQEVPTAVNISESHILITRPQAGVGCNTNVGKAFPSGPQLMNLEGACMNAFGVPVHEIGHSVGLWHEQSRTDRDAWIAILNQNILPDSFSQAQYQLQVDTDSLGVPYDYGSVMHYSPVDFSVANDFNQPTMRATNPLYQQTMGQRAELSFSDIKKINLAYCQGSCQGFNLSAPCTHGGYQDPKNCTRCRCPDGFSGQFCQSVAPAVNATCGEVILLNPGEERTINSPGYDNPGYYEAHQECSWWIKVPVGQQIQLRFIEMIALLCSPGGCAFHWVEVQYKADLGELGPRFCCYDLPSAIITSESNEMMIIFKSNFSHWYTPHRGFKANLTTIISTYPSTVATTTVKDTTSPQTSSIKTTTPVVTTGPRSTVFTTGPRSTVVTTSPRSTVVTTGPRSTVVTTGPRSTVVTSVPRSTVVTSGPSSTVFTSSPRSTVVTSGPRSTVITSGPRSTVVTSGPLSTVVTSGSASTVATSGSHSTAVTSGPRFTVVTSGPRSTVVTTGPPSTVVTSGPRSTGFTSGPRSTVVTSGPPCIVPDCVKCVPGVPNKCTQCRPGFGTLTPTNQTRCIQCSTRSGCAKCCTLTQCTVCNSTALAPKTDESGECAACASNCRLCTTNGPDKCDSCNAGYYLQPNKTCTVCPVQYCQSCNATKCTSCLSGYSLNSSTTSSTCSACGSDCLLCNTNPGKCDPGYCKTGFHFVSETKTCAKCLVDVVFVIDNSGSISDNRPNGTDLLYNWNLVVKFVQTLTLQLNVGIDSTHVAALTFGNLSYLEFPLNRYFTAAEVNSAVASMKFRGELTNTVAGLKLGREVLSQSQYGARDSGIPKVIILITDGIPTINQELVDAEVAAADAASIRIVVVGVTNMVNQTLLRAIASGPNDYTFVEDFNSLDLVRNTVLNSETCKPLTTTLPPNPSTSGPACIVPDCVTCVPGVPNKCTQCRPGFGTLTPTNQTRCIQCKTRSGCAKCDSLTQCTICNSTALAPKRDGSGECAACASNCRLCTTNGPEKCDSCNSGYSLQPNETCTVTVTNPCPNIPFCVSCPDDPMICKTCRGPTGVYGFRPDARGCDDCNQVSGNTCSMCSNLTKCDRCTDDSTGYVTGTQTAQCAACADKCISCTSSGANKCDPGACEPGFGLDATSQTCGSCSEGCQSCNGNGAGYCDTCPAGQGLIVSTGVPPDDCADCSDINCAECFASNTLCEVCDPGFGKDASGKCVTTGGLIIVDDPSAKQASSDEHCSMTDCVTCVMVYGTPQCTQCRYGYGTPSNNDSSYCLPCSTKSGCSDCDSLSQCSTCDSSAMTPKRDGSGECAACAANCRKCDDAGPGKCDICAAGYSLWTNDTCTACSVEHCQICDDGYCTDCKSGYTLNTTSTTETCQACGRSCKFCNKNPGKCDPGFCENGFIYNSEMQTCEFAAAVVQDSSSDISVWGSSVATPSDSDSRKSGTLIGIIIGSTLGGIALISLIVYFCCFHKRYVHEMSTMNDYDQNSTYQTPSQQKSWDYSYRAPVMFYQNSALSNHYTKRFQPSLSYDDRY